MPLNISDSAFDDNQEPRLPLVLLVDISGSMSGEPINQLNSGLVTFKREVATDEVAADRVEIAIVTFGGNVRLIQDFVTVDNFTPPNLSTTGDTPMGQAIEQGISLLESRKAIYKAQAVDYFRPWMMLITDGEPTDGDQWKNASQKLKEAVNSRKLYFYAIGVQDANMDVLRQIAPPDSPPKLLDGLKFQELFRWLSASVREQSRRIVGKQDADTPPIIGWAKAD